MKKNDSESDSDKDYYEGQIRKFQKRKKLVQKIVDAPLRKLNFVTKAEMAILIGLTDDKIQEALDSFIRMYQKDLTDLNKK